MYKLKIKGNRNLEGIVKISGSKNSAVALIPAAILSSEEVEINNLPNITDIKNLKNILSFLNIKYEEKEDSLKINSNTLENKYIPTNVTDKLRASYYFMGAILGKKGYVEISFPGGCVIGKRPIDLHLKGFKALGAKIIEEEDKIIIKAKELKGNKIFLDFASVGATINIILASVLAKGETLIENAAKEPEVIDLCKFLNKMGAKIYGYGTEKIKIVGVNKLYKVKHPVIPDRIEAATYMCLASVAGKHVKIENINISHLKAVIEKLKEINVDITCYKDSVLIKKVDTLNTTFIKTSPYPGFPTDLQQIFASILTQARGQSFIHETIFENRFNNLIELKKMGANISFSNNLACITGPSELNSAEVNASDLRAGASLLIAAFLTHGTTIINNADYILRGYSNVEEKLRNLGAKVELIEI